MNCRSHSNQPRIALALASLASSHRPPLRAEVAVKGKTIHTMNGEADHRRRRHHSRRQDRRGRPRRRRSPIPDGFRVTRGRGRHAGPDRRAQHRRRQRPLQHRRTIRTSSSASRADPARAARDRRLQPAARSSSSWVRGFGVTTVHTGHAPGELISGQTCIVKTARQHGRGRRSIVPTAMVAATLGPRVRSTATRVAGHARQGRWRCSAASSSRPETYMREADESPTQTKAPTAICDSEMLGRVLKRETAAAGHGQPRPGHRISAAARRGVQDSHRARFGGRGVPAASTRSRPPACR